MADPKSYIGATVGLSAAQPASTDNAGFIALSYTTVGKIQSVSGLGDETNDISAPLLSGRVFHQNGVADGGQVDFVFLYDPATDVGQQLALAKNNTNDPVSLRIGEPDGKVEYVYGVLCNFKGAEKNTTNMKSFSFSMRVNSQTIRPGF